MLHHNRHNIHAMWKTIVAYGKPQTTTCELCSYVIEMVGDYNLFFPHVTLYPKPPAVLPARGSTHVAATCNVGCQMVVSKTVSQSFDIHLERLTRWVSDRLNTGRSIFTQHLLHQRHHAHSRLKAKAIKNLDPSMEVKPQYLHTLKGN